MPIPPDETDAIDRRSSSSPEPENDIQTPDETPVPKAHQPFSGARIADLESHASLPRPEKFAVDSPVHQHQTHEVSSNSSHRLLR
jgi:hypothetical protein